MAEPLGYQGAYSPPASDRELPLRLSGAIKKKELRSLTRKVRSGHVGPTSVYYAGVTAPAIAAGMATLVAASLNRAEMHEMVVFQASSIVAAMAGISWYLIFMRWSYRHDLGRGSELATETEVTADELGVYWSRGAMKTRIDWSGITDVRYERNFVRICVRDGDDVILPNSWFEKRSDKKAAYHRLKALRDGTLDAESQAA